MTDKDKPKPSPAEGATVSDVMRDYVSLQRALGILHRMQIENTGWRSFFRRWYYADEPLRNDAANLVHECGFIAMRPVNTRSLADDR